MIRSILITSANGLLLFAKEFVNNLRQHRLVASLMVAVVEMAKQTTGLNVAYIEMDKVGVVLVSLEAKRVNCILFQDPQDGEDFGRMIASRVLCAFAERYASAVMGPCSPSGKGKCFSLRCLVTFVMSGFDNGANLSGYDEFHALIGPVIRESIKPVMDELQQHRAIHLVLFVVGGVILCNFANHRMI